MIQEMAVLNIVQGQTSAFESAFATASEIIASMPGYISHQLQRCIEDENRYLLLVQWKTLDDHTVGFRDSIQYLEWKRLLHHFYDPFPVVEHYTVVQHYP